MRNTTLEPQTGRRSGDYDAVAAFGDSISAGSAIRDLETYGIESEIVALADADQELTADTGARVATGTMNGLVLGAIAGVPAGLGLLALMSGDFSPELVLPAIFFGALGMGCVGGFIGSAATQPRRPGVLETGIPPATVVGIRCNAEAIDVVEHVLEAHRAADVAYAVPAAPPKRVSQRGSWPF